MSDSLIPTSGPFVFDWQQLSRSDFLHWFVPMVIVDMPDGHFKELSERTSKWSDVQVQILINGVEVNAAHFLEGVERNLEIQAKHAAREMLDEVGGLDALDERIREIRTHLTDQFEAALRERGIELPDRDEWS